MHCCFPVVDKGAKCLPSAVIHRSKLFLSQCISLLGGSNQRLGSGPCKNLTKDDEGVSAPSLSVLCLSFSVFLSVSLCLPLTVCVVGRGEGCLFQFFPNTMPLDLQFKNKIWEQKSLMVD